MATRARRALLVLPSYDVPGLDPVVRTTLLECGVLPSDHSSELLVTYERLDELLPKYYPTASVRMTPRGVKGTFGMPAGNQQVRHLNVGHRDGLTSNSDSDGDTDL